MNDAVVATGVEEVIDALENGAPRGFGEAAAAVLVPDDAGDDAGGRQVACGAGPS